MSNKGAAPLIHEWSSSSVLFASRDEIVATAEHIIALGIEYIALVSIHLSYAKEGACYVHQTSYAENTTRYLLHDLRARVRKTDSVFQVGHTLYFLLHGANEQGGQIVQDRLWEALLWRVHNLSEREMIRPQSLTTGHSSYPMHTTLYDLVETADEVILRFDTQPEKVLQEHGVISQSQPEKEDPEQDLTALARKLGIPYRTLLPSTFPQSLQQIVTPKLAQELRCYPVGRERNRLTVAMLHPVDHSALDRLKQETGLHIFPVLTHPLALQVALEQLV